MRQLLPFPARSLLRNGLTAHGDYGDDGALSQFLSDLPFTHSQTVDMSLKLFEFLLPKTSVKNVLDASVAQVIEV